MEYTVNLGKESLRKIADAISGGVEVEPLEVTENGEYTAPDGKAYSPVSVNVEGSGGGSSDFSTAQVTIINNTLNRINGNQFPCYVEENELEEGSPAAITTTIEGFVVGETTIKVPLYKGYAILYTITEEQITVSGDIATVGVGTLVVSGNGTITFDTPQ